MKYGISFFLAMAFVVGAYLTAESRIKKPLNLQSLKLGMSLSEVEKLFGTASAHMRNQYTFVLHEGSELTITLRDEKVSSATVKFHQEVKIQDPEMKKLSLVQMDPLQVDSSPSWFYAGKPEEGLIYKITSRGIIESLTWVPPFTYGSSRPKQLQALLRDFRIQRSL